LLTDKTGTLTQNDMIFKKLNMEYAAFDLENVNDLKNFLLENCQQNQGGGPMADVQPLEGSLNNKSSAMASSLASNQSLGLDENMTGSVKRGRRKGG